jgi:hypothetical protein
MLGDGRQDVNRELVGFAGNRRRETTPDSIKFDMNARV